MNHPSHRVLLSFIFLLVGIFLAQLSIPSGLEQWNTVPLDVETGWERLLAGQFATNDAFAFATLLTGPLMHGGWEHLFFNLLYLWIFAGVVGELLGVRWMLALLVTTAVAGAVGDTLLRSGSAIPSLGISGAVMGFQGAYLGLAVRWSLPDPEIWPISHPIAPLRLGILAVVGFGLDVSGAIDGGGDTAFGAHLGGFIVGLFLTCFIAPRPSAA